MKQLLMLLQLFLLILCLKCDVEIISKSQFRDGVDWRCEQMDTAFIIFDVVVNDQQVEAVKLTVNYQYEICVECDLIVFKEINHDSTTVLNATIDSYYSYFFDVKNENDDIICARFVYRDFGECGVYKLRIDTVANQCLFEQVRNSQNSDLYLILGVGLVLIFFVISIVIEKYHVRMKIYLTRKLCRYVSSVKSDEETGEIKLGKIGGKTGDDDNVASATVKKPLKQRLISLDAFRGLSLFLMIFVNYGSGYSSFYVPQIRFVS